MSVFKITISNPGGKSGDHAGFVDIHNVEKHMVLTTKQQAMDKMRGVIRYQNILGSIGLVTTYEAPWISLTGGSSTKEASTLEMELRIQDDSSLAVGEYVGAEAIRELVATGLAISRTTNCDYYDPDSFSETMPLTVGGLGSIDECRAMVTVVTS